MKTIAVKFYEARVLAGLTHDEAARGICATSYISLIESGRRQPSQKLLEAFSERFGVVLVDSSKTDDLQQVELVLLDASIAIDEGDLSRAEALLENLSNAGVTRELQAKRILLMARIAMRNLEFTHAIELLESTLFKSKFRALAFPVQESFWIEYLKACYDSGNLPQAMLKGSELIASGDIIGFSPTAQITIKCQLAGCHLELGNNLQAFRFASEASESAYLLDDPLALARAEWQMATVASTNQKTDEAAEWMRKAISHAEQAEMMESIHRMKIALASILLESEGQDLERIAIEMEKVRDESVFIGKFIESAFACAVISDISIKRGDFERGGKVAKDGLAYLNGQAGGPFLELKLNLARCEFEKSKDLEDWRDAICAIENVTGHGGPEIRKNWRLLARVAIDLGEIVIAAQAYEAALGSDVSQRTRQVAD